MPLLILIAEDDPGIRLAVSDCLELSGYSAIAAKDGREALSMLENYHPHLLISDIKMPGIDGYELVKQIRQRPRFRLLPVIFLTERDSTRDRVRGYQVGCDIYLPKPFEIEELAAVVRNLMERSQTIHAEISYFHREQPLPPQYSAKETSLLFGEEAIDLTKRETEVLNLITTGLSNTEIGSHLHLSPRTIEKHVSNLLRKTETSNRAELVRFALENHLIR